jgi:hypothetical protein
MPQFPFEASAENYLDVDNDDSTASLLSLASFDVPSGHVIRYETRADWYAEARRVIRPANAAPDRSVGFLDTTTLINALSLLSSNAPIVKLPAGAILDLGTFVNAYVFEDDLVYLDPDAPHLMQLMESALPADAPLSALRWQSNTTHSTVLTHLWDAAERFTAALCKHDSWQPLLREYWSIILGADVPPDFYEKQTAFRDYFSSVSSLAMEQAVVGSDRYHDWSANSFDDWMGLQDEFAAESTLRAVFCQLYACCIDASYYSNVYRAQVRKLVSDKLSQDAPAVNSAMISFVQREFWKSASADAQSLFDATPIELPLVLFAVLRGADRATMCVERLCTIREKAALFRAHRAELSDAFARGEIAAVTALRRAVSEDARAFANLNELAGQSRMLRGILTVGGARPVLGALGCLASHFLKLPDDVKSVVRARMVRPELWFLTGLAAEARETMQALPALRRILRSRGYAPTGDQNDILETEIQRLSSASS